MLEQDKMNVLYYPGSDGSYAERLEEKIKEHNTTVVGAPDGADRRDMLRFYLLRNHFDLVVLDEGNEIEVIDLTDKVVSVVEGSYSPYTKRVKPTVAIVGHDNLVRMLNSTHRNTGIRFVQARRDEGRIAVEDSCSQ